MPKISDTQRETRRQQILDAALRCFSRDGFHATTTADIVRESGVSQGTLYLYFATKDDIVVALADDRHQREALVHAIAASEQDPVEGLFMLVDLHGQGISDARRNDAQRVGIQGWAEALRNPRIRESAVEGTSIVRQAIVGLIERGKATGQVRADVDGEALARVMIALFHGLLIQRHWGEPLDLPAIGAVAREMIKGALAPAPSNPN